MNKELYIKAYNTSGALTKYISEFAFSEPTETINGGAGVLNLAIPNKAEDLTNQIERGYQIKVVAHDGVETTVYNGRVDEIKSSIGDLEQTTIVCSGYIAELAQNLHEDGGVVRFNYIETAIEDIVKDILDKHNTSLSTAKVDYNGSSIGTTGKNITVKFFASTVLEAIRSVVNQADKGWFFRVGSDNVFYLFETPSTPDHYFTIGCDVAKLQLVESDRTKITRYLFFNGRTENEPDNIFKLYSSGATDRRFLIKRDNRFTVEASVDERADRILNTFGDGTGQVTARIIDSNIGGGYNIESINIGDTCKFLNVDSNLNLPSNGVIVSKLYSKDYVDIVIEDSEEYVSRMLIEQRQRQNLAEFNEELPESYTT